MIRSFIPEQPTVVVIPILLVVGVVFALSRCGGAGDQSAQIAAKIGAASCTAESYEVISRLDNSKTRIYDCTLNGKRLCVSEQNGIASDQTAVVRLLFANALGSARPSCLG